MKKFHIVLIGIFCVAFMLRSWDAFRPIDQESWRESDVGSIARNFTAADMDIRYPQIDWRGTTQGYAEMEFPVYPWMIAVTYRIFGIHDHYGRIWSLVFSLLSMFVFYKAAREYLGETGVLFAVAFLAFNPIFVELSTAIQPEGLMFLFYISAFYFFVKWIRTDLDKYFWCAAIATSLTILAKATAGHIGLLFLILLWRKYGTALFRLPKVWIFAAVGLVPAVIWYVHSHSFWVEYGKSLGVSNEYHWVGTDFFTNPYFVTGIVHSELFGVWVLAGILIAAFTVWYKGDSDVVRHSLFWFAGIFIFDFIAARTTADPWARYYHIFSVPPAALLFGCGAESLIPYYKDVKTSLAEKLTAGNLTQAVIVAALWICVAATFLLDMRQNINGRRLRNVPASGKECSAEFASRMSRPGSILVSGGNAFDEDGYPVAYDAPYMFYWLERKGFVIPAEKRSAQDVQYYADLGAEYFVADKKYVDHPPSRRNELSTAFSLIDECRDYIIFDLNP